MGKTCAVIDCKNDQSVNTVSLFKFRKQEAWLKFLRYANGEYGWETVSGMYLCSEHFRSDFIVEGANRRDIAKKGYPSLLHGVSTIPNDPEEEDQFELSGAAVVTIKEHPETDVCKCCSKVKEQAVQIDELAQQLQVAVKEKELLQLKLTEAAEKVKKRGKDVRVLMQSKKRNEKTKRKLESKVDSMAKKARNEAPASDPADKQSTLIAELTARIKSHPKSPFSEFMREFSFLLHYYGPRAYDFARSYLKALPHPLTLSQWVKHIETKPGFLPCSIEFLKRKIAEADEEILLAVSLDEVYTRKQILHDGDGFIGFTDYGDIAENHEPEKEATTALFIMVTAINSDFRVPVGYALTHGLKADTLASIIKKTLEAMNQINGRVLTVTFDGLGVNMRAVEKLGANFNVLEEGFKSYILHPQTNQKVYIILDPSHMFKLLRNLWNHFKLLVDKDGNKVRWSLITELQKLQEKCGMRLANKLSTRHVHFHKQKMKTNLCLQTLSSSVSVALGVCEELDINGFQDSKPTEKFLALTDRLFDSMNSKSTGKGCKSPLKPSNMDIYRKLFGDAKEYFANLKVAVKGELVPIIQTGRKTAIVGLFVTMASLEGIMDEVAGGDGIKLKFLPTYKLSQDPLEMFFSVLRSRFGYNNNPNAKQLKHALKGILATNTRSINTGNCLEQEYAVTKVSPLGNYNAIMYDECSVEEHDEEDDESDVYESIETTMDHDMQAVVNNVVGYVSGYVVRKICERLKCPKCVCKLMADTEDVERIMNDCVLILHKDNGGLIYPSANVIAVCKLTELAVREAKELGVRRMSKNGLMRSVYSKCMERGLIRSLCCDENQNMEGEMDHSHASILVREISSRYLKARLHFIAKECSYKIAPTTVRSTCVNLTQFGGN